MKLVAALLVATLALSSTLRGHAANPVYTEPTGAPEQLAYITGSPAQTSVKGPPKVYVWGVDRQEVPDAEEHWSKQVAVTPGRHLITVAIKGLFYQEFEVDLCAGCRYQAHVSYVETSGLMIRKHTSDFWLTRLPEGEEVTAHKAGLAIPVKATIYFQRY